MNKPYKFKLWHILLVPFLPFIVIYYIAVSKKIQTNNKIVYIFMIVFVLFFFYLISPKLQAIQINVSKTSLFFEENSSISVEFNPSDQGDLKLLKCESSDTNVVTIANLKIITKGEGQATITCSYDNITSNEVIVNVELTEKQKFSKRLNAVIEKTGDIGYQYFLNAGTNYSIDFIEELSRVYEVHNLGQIKLAGRAIEQGEELMTAFETENGLFRVYSINNDITRIIDNKNEALYDNNKVKENYILNSYINRDIRLISGYVEIIVNGGLKYPKTAEYIDLKNINSPGWSVLSKNGYVNLISIVRAENSYGEMVPNLFLVQFKYVDKKFEVVFAEVGEWSIGTFTDLDE